MVKIRYMEPAEVEDISSFRRMYLGEYIENKFKSYICKNPYSVLIANSDDKKDILGYAFAYLWRSDTGIIHHVLSAPESKSVVEKELLNYIEEQFLKRKLNRAYAWAREDQKDLIRNLYSMNYTLDCEMLVFENKDISLITQTSIGNNEISISEFTKKHLNDVLEIEKKCFKPSWHQNEEDFLRYAKRKCSRFSVATDYERAVAYLQIASYQNLGYLGRVAVHPNYQRKGIGTRLMNEAIKWFEKNNAKKIKLRSPKSDFPAHTLYKNFGFSEIGREYEFIKRF